MLQVLKRTVSMRRFFWAPKTYAENMGINIKKILKNFTLKFFVYLNLCIYICIYMYIHWSMLLWSNDVKTNQRSRWSGCLTKSYFSLSYSLILLSLSLISYSLSILLVSSYSLLNLSVTWWAPDCSGTSEQWLWELRASKYSKTCLKRPL